MPKKRAHHTTERLRELAILADMPFQIAALVGGALALINEGTAADKEPGMGFARDLLMRAADELDTLASDIDTLLL